MRRLSRSFCISTFSTKTIWISLEIHNAIKNEKTTCISLLYSNIIPQLTKPVLESSFTVVIRNRLRCFIMNVYPVLRQLFLYNYTPQLSVYLIIIKLFAYRSQLPITAPGKYGIPTLTSWKRATMLFNINNAFYTERFLQVLLQCTACSNF